MANFPEELEVEAPGTPKIMSKMLRPDAPSRRVRPAHRNEIASSLCSSPTSSPTFQARRPDVSDIVKKLFDDSDGESDNESDFDGEQVARPDVVLRLTGYGKSNAEQADKEESAAERLHLSTDTPEHFSPTWPATSPEERVQFFSTPGDAKDKSHRFNMSAMSASTVASTPEPGSCMKVLDTPSPVMALTSRFQSMRLEKTAPVMPRKLDIPLVHEDGSLEQAV